MRAVLSAFLRTQRGVLLSCSFFSPCQVRTSFDAWYNANQFVKFPKWFPLCWVLYLQSCRTRRLKFNAFLLSSQPNVVIFPVNYWVERFISARTCTRIRNADVPAIISNIEVVVYLHGNSSSRLEACNLAGMPRRTSFLLLFFFFFFHSAPKA